MGVARTCAAQGLPGSSAERLGKAGQLDAGEGAGAGGTCFRGATHAGGNAGGANDRDRASKGENRTAQSGLQYRAIRDADGGAGVRDVVMVMNIMMIDEKAEQIQVNDWMF